VRKDAEKNPTRDQIDLLCARPGRSLRVFFAVFASLARTVLRLFGEEKFLAEIAKIAKKKMPQRKPFRLRVA
jgi:hypothetical protein